MYNLIYNREWNRRALNLRSSSDFASTMFNSRFMVLLLTLSSSEEFHFNNEHSNPLIFKTSNKQMTGWPNNSVSDVSLRDAFPFPNGWIFGKVPNGLWPPPHFRKVMLQFFSEIHDRSIVFNGKNLQHKFLDWKWPPPPLELFWKFIRFGRVKLPLVFTSQYIVYSLDNNVT